MIISTKRILLTVTLLSVISFALKAQTNVSGGIYSNVTWTKANSPYIVTANIVVFPGDTLTIEPGVVVKFADSTSLEIRQATISALGTATDSITFTSNSPVPVQGIWGDINLNGDMNAAFNYCNFLYSSIAVIAAISDTIIIKNSNFIDNSIGVLLNTAQSVFIDTCNFRNNGNGITSNGYPGDYPNVNYCFFINNYIGIGDDSGDGLSAGDFNNCIIDSNNIGAEFAADALSSSFENCTINNNQIGIWFFCTYSIQNCIINNNQSGILSDGTDGTIKNCTIDSNNSMGVQLESGSLVGCEVKKNGTGIDYYYGNNGIITMNIIENNMIGISYEGNNAPSIYCNKICSNSSYDFENNSASNIAIPNNFWCSTDSATIASYIYDGYDTIILGLVTFMPLDTSVCYLTTGITNISQNFSFKLFPNPASNNLTLLLPENVSNGTIKIFDLLGKLQYTSAIVKQETNMDVSTLANGIYIVEVSYGDIIKRQKFVKE